MSNAQPIPTKTMFFLEWLQLPRKNIPLFVVYKVANDAIIQNVDVEERK